MKEIFKYLLKKGGFYISEETNSLAIDREEAEKRYKETQKRLQELQASPELQNLVQDIYEGFPQKLDESRKE